VLLAAAADEANCAPSTSAAVARLWSDPSASCGSNAQVAPAVGVELSARAGKTVTTSGSSGGGSSGAFASVMCAGEGVQAEVYLTGADQKAPALAPGIRHATRCGFASALAVTWTLQFKNIQRKTFPSLSSLFSLRCLLFVFSPSLFVLFEPLSAWCLSARTGRPDVPRILATTARAAAAAGRTRVAVLACGPAALMRDVAAAVDAHNNATGRCLCGEQPVLFDLHLETFEL
jgi:hypothetical protein